MDYPNTSAKRQCGAGVNNMDLVYAKALCLTFLNVYISVTTHWTAYIFGTWDICSISLGMEYNS